MGLSVKILVPRGRCRHDDCAPEARPPKLSPSAPATPTWSLAVPGLRGLSLLRCSRGGVGGQKGACRPAARQLCVSVWTVSGAWAETLFEWGMRVCGLSKRFGGLQLLDLEILCQSDRAPSLCEP
jgi:hypothetical protein